MSRGAAPSVAETPAQNRHRGVVAIREATLADVPRLTEMASAFLADSVYGALFPSAGDYIASIVAEVLDRGVVLVADAEGEVVGMIGLVLYEHQLSRTLWAKERVWWVEPAARGPKVGVELLAAAETWGARHGATHLELSTPDESGLSRGLARLGYQPIETAHVKELG